MHVWTAVCSGAVTRHIELAKSTTSWYFHIMAEITMLPLQEDRKIAIRKQKFSGTLFYIEKLLVIKHQCTLET